MSDTTLTPVEKYLKEIKDFSRLLLVLSVAMTTVIGASYDVKEDTLLKHTLEYIFVVLSLLLSIIFGLSFHWRFTNLFQKMYEAKEPETFFSKDNPELETAVFWISLQLIIQLATFALSIYLFVKHFMLWQILPLIGSNQRLLELYNRWTN